MKKVLLILICLILCSCSNNDSIETQLKSVFEDATNENVRTNNYTEYIEYYIPSDVNEVANDKLSYVFDIDGCGVIMNINISGIINKQYYEEDSLLDEGYFDENKLVYSYGGEYINGNDETVQYFVKAYEYERECMLYLVTNEVNLYGKCGKHEAKLVGEKMFKMAKACNVNEDRIINDFSSKDVIDYKKSTVNLFENIFPVEGRVEDLMVDNTPKVSE